MNLSDSGSCDFGNANLWRANAIPTRVRKNLFNKILNKRGSDKINASSELFEAIDSGRNNSSFLKIITLPLEQTIEWVSYIRKDASILPKSPFEKVLFSILHVASDGGLSPISVVWLFYGLETLLATRPGENKKSIEERAVSLLGLDQKQAKKLGKDLKELYDFRSSIVHGGSEIVHVMGEFYR